jgi:hypothetical protein
VKEKVGGFFIVAFRKILCTSSSEQSVTIPFRHYLDVLP